MSSTLSIIRICMSRYHNNQFRSQSIEFSIQLFRSHCPTAFILTLNFTCPTTDTNRRNPPASAHPSASVGEKIGTEFKCRVEEKLHTRIVEESHIRRMPKSLVSYSLPFWHDTRGRIYSSTERVIQSRIEAAEFQVAKTGFRPIVRGFLFRTSVRVRREIWTERNVAPAVERLDVLLGWTCCSYL